MKCHAVFYFILKKRVLLVQNARKKALFKKIRITHINLKIFKGFLINNFII